jgi:hypothetical protein
MGNRIEQDSLGAFLGLRTRDGKLIDVRTGNVSLSRVGNNPGVETLHFLTWVIKRETFLSPPFLKCVSERL